MVEGDTLATYIPKLGAVPLAFQPGTQRAYNGYAAPDTRSRIVELVSGQPHNEFLRARILEPSDPRRNRIRTAKPMPGIG